jgi:hypothetical protein
MDYNLFLVSIFIISICIYFIYNRLIVFLPKSETTTHFDKYIVKLELDKIPIRKFEIFGKFQLQTINEIFHHPKIEWKEKNKVKYAESSFHLFEDFKCKYYKSVPFDTIPANTLIYFPENNIKWKDEIFLYEPISDTHYFPKVNSIILHNKKLEWKGDKNIFLILGKLID